MSADQAPREQVRADIRRVAVAGLVLLSMAGLIALVYATAWSATASAAAAAGLGIVGIGLVVAGVVAWGGTGSIRRLAGNYSINSAESRRAAEHLALGLLSAGIAFSAAALVIG